jgi:cell division protein ZapB
LIIAHSTSDFVYSSAVQNGNSIDRTRYPHYICCMTTNIKQTHLVEQELSHLEEQVDSLLAIIERLARENRSLRAQQESLATERAGLLEKHDQVRGRVDAIVTRLKSLESGA